MYKLYCHYYNQTDRTPEICLECFVVERKWPIRSEETKSEATVFSFVASAHVPDIFLSLDDTITQS